VECECVLNVFTCMCVCAESPALELVIHPNGYEGRSAAVLEWRYKVEQLELWGGFMRISHFPRYGRYSLKGNTHITFWYNSLVPQSSPARAQFRLILDDSSHCAVECWKRPRNEVYFSFFTILDSNPGWHQAVIELRGSGDPASPFWRPGWIGVQGK
jgi:hypothetical protein